MIINLIILITCVFLIIYKKNKKQHVDWKIKFTIVALVISIVTMLLSLFLPIESFFRRQDLIGIIILSMINIPVWMLWITVLLSKIPVLKTIIKTNTYTQTAISIGSIGLIIPTLVTAYAAITGSLDGWGALPSVILFVTLVPCSLLAFISIPIVYSYKKYPECFRLILKIILIGVTLSAIFYGIILFNNNSTHQQKTTTNEKTKMENVLKDLNNLNSKNNNKYNNDGYSTYTLNF